MLFLESFQQIVQQRYYLVWANSTNGFVIEEAMNDLFVGTVDSEEIRP